MGLGSLLKKASMGLGSILLACNMGCNSTRPFHNVDYLDQRPQNLESKVPLKLKKWQYPLNIAGGYLTHILAHESGHALTCLAFGIKVTKFKPYPLNITFDNTTEFHSGWVDFDIEEFNNLSPYKKALIHIAGPLTDIALTETINYNLRNGNISKQYQPFWATTSLSARLGPLSIAVGAFTNQKLNDFKHFEQDTGISAKTIAGLTFLYTALSAKRIKKELKVAFGRDTYPVKDKRKGRFDIFPSQNGFGINYTMGF